MSDDPTRSAFDLHSREYLAGWERDPVASLQRARVRRLLERHIGAKARCIDLGCGPGVDAAWLARGGREVVAVDASPGMLDVARTVCDGLPVTCIPGDLASGDLPAGPFDAALSNFGALNCVPSLGPVAGALASRLLPGAPFVLVLMAHRAPTEALALLAAGHPREALRRRRASEADVGGRKIPVWFWRPAEVAAAFGPAFDLVERRPIGLLLPPPGSIGRRWHGSAPWLDPFDAVVTALPGVPAWGDHVAYVLRRRATAGDAP